MWIPTLFLLCSMEQWLVKFLWFKDSSILIFIMVAKQKNLLDHSHKILQSAYIRFFSYKIQAKIEKEIIEREKNAIYIFFFQWKLIKFVCGVCNILNWSYIKYKRVHVYCAELVFVDVLSKHTHQMKNALQTHYNNFFAPKRNNTQISWCTCYCSLPR